MSSRAFGAPVEKFDELHEAIASYIARAAEKLRLQSSVAAAVYVFIHTNRFKEAEPQYGAGVTVALIDPSDDTLRLIAAAREGLEAIYREGYRYKKAGVMLTMLSEKDARQRCLFDNTASTEKSSRLMRVLDAVNAEFGRDTLRSAASGRHQRWAMRSEMRSPRYTTRWDELPVAS